MAAMLEMKKADIDAGARGGASPGLRTAGHYLSHSATGQSYATESMGRRSQAALE
jgi:hypothetical protein